MKIQVLGSGCPTCKMMYETVKKAAADLKIDTAIEYITDINKMVEMGVMTSPVLAINGQPALAGAFSEEKIKEVLKKAFPSG